MAVDQSVDVTTTRATAGTCFVAVLNGTLVGTVALTLGGEKRGTPHYCNPRVAIFGQFGVDPPHQNAGIGHALVAACEREAIAQGAASIALDTAEGATRLIDWYGRLGCRFIEYAQWRHTNYRSVIMDKPL